MHILDQTHALNVYHSFQENHICGESWLHILVIRQWMTLEDNK